MAGVASDAALPARADKALGAGQFGSDGRRRDAVGVSEILFVFLGDRGSNACAGMRSTGLVGEVRAIKMCAHNASAARLFVLETPTQRQDCQKLIVTPDRRRRQQARGAVPCMRPADGAKGGLGTVHEVVAVAAVD